MENKKDEIVITSDKINYSALCDCIKRIELLCKDCTEEDCDDLMPKKEHVLRAIKIISTGLINYNQLPYFITVTTNNGIIVEYKSEKYRLDIRIEGDVAPLAIIFNNETHKIVTQESFYLDMIKEI